MTNSATTAFTDFYNTFAAPVWERIPLQSADARIIVDMDRTRVSHKPQLLFYMPERKHDRHLPVISIRPWQGVSCLHIKVWGREVRANDWLHLAEQLEIVNPADFPEAARNLLRQAGGDPDFKNYFKLDM